MGDRYEKPINLKFSFWVHPALAAARGLSYLSEATGQRLARLIIYFGVITQMNVKEKALDSGRFKAIIATIIVEVGLLLLPQFGIEVDPELLQTVALAIAGLVSSYVVGRSIRNTATTNDKA